MATKEKKKKNLLKILNPVTKFGNPIEHAKMGAKVGTSIAKKGLSKAKGAVSKGKKFISKKADQGKKLLSQGKETVKTVQGKVTKANDTSKAVKKIDEKLKTKTGSSGKTRAQRMALERRKAKLKGTYKKPKTAQELAKERIKAREEAKKVKKTSRGKQRR